MRGSVSRRMRVSRENIPHAVTMAAVISAAGTAFTMSRRTSD